jgi:methylated-DNA-[protein]-cysteine S-methyltransferase
MNVVSLYESAWGMLQIVSKNEVLTEFRANTQLPLEYVTNNDPFHQEVRRQMDAYFAGKLQTFDLPIDPAGTPFQLSIWTLLQKIPYGHTISYVELARLAGDEKKIRAVAHANALNPIWIIIPCHRVIAKDGRLTGYAGGLQMKSDLLRLEGALAKTLWDR